MENREEKIELLKSLTLGKEETINLFPLSQVNYTFYVESSHQSSRLLNVTVTMKLTILHYTTMVSNNFLFFHIENSDICLFTFVILVSELN